MFVKLSTHREYATHPRETRIINSVTILDGTQGVLASKFITTYTFKRLSFRICLLN